MTAIDEWDGRGTLPMLYAKTATGAVQTWLCWVVGDTVWVNYGQKDGAMQSAQFKCEPKNEGRSNATTAHEQAIKEAIAKWKKQVKKKYYEEESEALGLVRIKPMLATNFDEHKHKLVYPASAQPKFNGVRCLAYIKEGKVYLQSRGSDPYVVHHIMQELTNVGWNTQEILDGELYVHGMALQDINSLVRRPRPESQALYYMIYDITWTACDWDWNKRGWALNDWFRRYGSRLSKIQQVRDMRVDDEAGVSLAHDHFVQMGYEGAVVRASGGMYRGGYRSHDLLKVKRFRDDEFEIVGFTAGRGKFANAPIFTCKTKEGKTFEVVPEGTAESRARMLAEAPSLTGQLLKVKFLEYSKDGIPVGNTVGLAIRGKDDM